MRFYLFDDLKDALGYICTVSCSDQGKEKILKVLHPNTDKTLIDSSYNEIKDCILGIRCKVNSKCIWANNHAPPCCLDEPKPCLDCGAMPWEECIYSEEELRLIALENAGRLNQEL